MKYLIFIASLYPIRLASAMRSEAESTAGRRNLRPSLWLRELDDNFTTMILPRTTKKRPSSSSLRQNDSSPKRRKSGQVSGGGVVAARRANPLRSNGQPQAKANRIPIQGVSPLATTSRSPPSSPHSKGSGRDTALVKPGIRTEFYTSSGTSSSESSLGPLKASRGHFPDKDARIRTKLEGPGQISGKKVDFQSQRKLIPSGITDDTSVSSPWKATMRGQTEGLSGAAANARGHRVKATVKAASWGQGGRIIVNGVNGEQSAIIAPGQEKTLRAKASSQWAANRVEIATARTFVRGGQLKITAHRDQRFGETEFL